MSASNEQDPGPVGPSTDPPGTPAVPTARPAGAAAPGRTSSVLLGVAVAGLVLVAVTDLLGVFAGLRVRAAIDGDGGHLTAGWQDLEDAVSFYDQVARYRLIVYLPCAIAFLTWFFHLRRATGPLAPDRFRHGTGWAVAAWLIPVGNLWLPYRVATEMWRAATPLPSEGAPYRERLWPVKVWWALFVLGTLCDRLAGTRYDSAGTLADIRSAVAQSLVADVLGLLAAAAAVHFAVRLTRMQRRRAGEGPYPTPPFGGASL